MNSEEIIGRTVLDAAFKVHTTLGPGLLESVYEMAMARELERRQLRVERQKAIPVYFEGEKLEVGFRADLIVQGLVLVELKSVDAVTPLFHKIVTNYLRLIPMRLGYLINFNEAHLKNGITRIVNRIEGKPFFTSTREVSREVGEGSEVSEGLDSSTSKSLPHQAGT